MKKLQIEFGENNPILRAVSTEIKTQEFSKYKSLAEAMIKHIKNPKNGGIGLAAPQIGVNKRLIVVSLMRDYEDENFRTIAMINPVITHFSESTCTEKEGCLSLPGLTGPVTRPDAVSVDFFDINGNKQHLDLTGLAARIVQHEIDHIDGILFIDKSEKVTLIEDEEEENEENNEK